MIRVLRNIGIHLWITTLLTLPLSFYILSMLTRIFPGISAVTTGLIIFLSIYGIIGFLMDRMAKNTVISLIKEGQAWERSGILSKAKKKYVKALRGYDTCLFGLFSAKKITWIITGAVARFELNTSVNNANFKLATAVYLKRNPDNADIALLWLEKLRQSARVTSFDQEVLSTLAEKHSANKSLSDIMIEIFLELDRKDFIAKGLYRNALKEPELKQKYSMKIENLIGRAEKGSPKLRKIFFTKPEGKHREKIEAVKKIQAIFVGTVLCLKKSVASIGSVFRFLILSVNKSISYIKKHEKAQLCLKTGILLLFSIGLLFFMINTLLHMLESRSIEKQEVKVQIQVPKPFTIQVAAYLKHKHAAAYVDILGKKGIDAKIRKVGGGGKTWFVVRVSEFVDKKTATAYGLKLKRQKIIDDFFVSNK